MPIDPRRAGGGSAEVRAAQNIADLERRIGQLERGTKGAVLSTGVALQTGGNLSLPTSAAIQAVPGCTFSTSSQVATSVSVTAAAQQLNWETTNVRLYLYLDGTAQTGSVVVCSVVGFAMNGGTWKVSLSAGSHTIALYASRASGGSTASTLANAGITYIQTRA
jgi:hypothetical protein